MQCLLLALLCNVCGAVQLRSSSSPPHGCHKLLWLRRRRQRQGPKGRTVPYPRAPSFLLVLFLVLLAYARLFAGRRDEGRKLRAKLRQLPRL